MLFQIVLVIALACPQPSDQAAPPPQPPAPAAAQPPEQPWPPAGVERMGRGVTAPRIIKEAKPQYPAIAREAGIQGTVLLEAVVGTDGTVTDVRVARSLDRDFGLDDVAVSTVKLWRFSPGTKDGAAVPILVDIEISFALRSTKTGRG